MVDAVIRLARALGMRVVAEGVETREQRDVLVGLGCHELQGFYFARPMPAEAFIAVCGPTAERAGTLAFSASAFMG